MAYSNYAINNKMTNLRQDHNLLVKSLQDNNIITSGGNKQINMISLEAEGNSDLNEYPFSNGSSLSSTVNFGVPLLRFSLQGYTIISTSNNINPSVSFQIEYKTFDSDIITILDTFTLNTNYYNKKIESPIINNTGYINIKYLGSINTDDEYAAYRIMLYIENQEVF
jgi:hypothetical protein